MLFHRNNMARDDDMMGGDVEATIALVVRGVAEEYAKSRVWSEFVGGCGCEVGVTGAPESAQVMVRGKGAMERKVRGAHVKSFGGEPIEEERGSGKSIGPVGRGHGSLKKEGSSDIVSGANHALGFPVLL
jgi:hypothetical protein